MNKIKDILLIGMCLFMLVGWTNTLRTDTPAGTDDPREADDRMREIKAAFVERLDIDHYFQASATSTYDATDSGMHRYITFQGPNTTPATIAANQARLYTKDVSSKAELHWIDEDENEIVITSAGEILFSSLGDVANDTYIKAVDAAGTGTVDLIKADANDIVTLPENTSLAAGVTPDANDEIVNKKYVDDQITAGADPTYSGGQSHTFGGGLIIKMGEVDLASSTTDTTVTFVPAFDTDCISVVTGVRQSSGYQMTYTASVFSISKDSFHFALTKAANVNGMTWIAIGY